MESMIVENPQLLMTILAVIFVWTLPWKGLALWRSARRGHIGWFFVFLLVNTLGILEILYIFIFGRKNGKKDSEDFGSDMKMPSKNIHNLQKPKMVL